MVTSDKLGYIGIWVREALDSSFQSFHLRFQCYTSPFGGPMRCVCLVLGQPWQAQVFGRRWFVPIKTQHSMK